MKLAFLIGTFLLLLFTPFDAGAKEKIPELASFVRQTIDRVEAGVNQPTVAPHYDSDFYLRRFLIEIKAKAAFDVEFGKIEAVPQIDLFWQKN